MSLLVLAAIALLGALGSLARFGADLALAPWAVRLGWPVATLAVNVLGSGLAGALSALGSRGVLTPEIQRALLVGFCGGFTTFSAYTLQAFDLASRGGLAGWAYLVASPIAGIAAAWFGRWAAQ